MAVGRKRGRAQGRFESGQKFAAIPEEVLRSEAYRQLPDSAVRILLAIAVQYRGNNNGDLSMTAGMAKEYGIGHKNLAAALPLLEMTGLLQRTRQGRLQGGATLCSLYALTWKPLNASDKYDTAVLADRRASNEWVHWVRPGNWAEIIKNKKRKATGRKISLIPPRGGDGRSPHSGSERGFTAPPVGDRN